MEGEPEATPKTTHIPKTIDLVDVVSVHSYSPYAEWLDNDLDLAFTYADRAGKPVIVSEFGNPGAGQPYEMALDVIERAEQLAHRRDAPDRPEREPDQQEEPDRDRGPGQRQPALEQFPDGRHAFDADIARIETRGQAELNERFVVSLQAHQ